MRDVDGGHRRGGGAPAGVRFAKATAAPPDLRRLPAADRLPAIGRRHAAAAARHRPPAGCASQMTFE